MRVLVDRDLCEANGVRAGLVPEAFEAGDSGELTILVDEVTAEFADGVRRAVASCPKTALRLGR